MTQLLHVTRFNNLMMLRKNYTMVFSTGNGSMADKSREKGWIVYDESLDWAKYYPNRKLAELEISVRN